ncbi:hypothetical protein DJ68_11440 [Halorubrum sp. C3]|nr:hypothetical protein DJ68_11440 [Halorubrum sp. C3]
MTSDETIRCEWDGCEREFLIRTSMKIYHSRTHGERLVDTVTCDHCGDEFEPASGATGTYCSTACAGAARSERVTLTCEECGDEFELSPSDAEGRKYCSKECYGVAKDTTEVRTCPCGTTFRTQQTSDKQTCSHSCEGELKTSKPRPDDVNALLWLLYEYEGHTIKETHKRANHHLDDDDRLTRDEVSDRLIEMGVHSNLIQIKAQQAAEREDVSADVPDGDETWRQYQEGRADD